MNFSKNDSRTCLYDESMYAAASVDHYYFYKDILNFNNFTINNFMHSLDHAIIEPYLGLMFFLFGKTFFTFRMAFLPLFLFFLLTVYIFGKQIQSKYVSILSILLILSSPLVISASRKMSPSIYLTSFLLLCLYFFMKSNNFNITKYALLFGTFLGLTSKIHYSGSIYVGLGIFFHLVTSPRNRMLIFTYSCLGMFLSCYYPSSKAFLPVLAVLFFYLFKKRRQQVYNVLNAITCALLFSNNHKQLFSIPSTLTSFTLNYMELSARNMSYWFSDFFHHSLFVILFLYSLYFMKRNKETYTKHRNLYFMALLFTAPTFGAIIANAEMHAYIPTFTLMSLLIACSVDKMPYRSVKYLLTGIIVFYVFLFNNPTNIKQSGYNLYHEAVTVNNSESIIKKENIKNFFLENGKDKKLVIGLFGDTYALWSELTPYVSLLCLQILSHNPIDAFLIRDINPKPEIMERIDFLLFEKKALDDSKTRLKLEKLLLNNQKLVLYKTLFYDNRKLYIFKNLNKKI